MHTSHTPSQKPSLTKLRSVHAEETIAPSSTPSCVYRDAVYQITCKNCNQHYIGSTTCFIHDHVKEHLKSENSSINKHITICQNKDYRGIEVKIIVLDNAPVNLRLFKSFYLRKSKPTLDSQEECIKFSSYASLMTPLSGETSDS